MSRIIDLLTAIKNNTAYSTETYSRIEAILKSIANDTSYTAEEQSRHEELLLDIKTGETTTLVPQTNIEELLVAIANGTLDEWLVGRNLFNESSWANKENINDKECLVFNGFFRTTDGAKLGNPLVIASGLKAGSYTVSGKFKKTTYFNALCVMDYENQRTAVGEFDSDFLYDSITFTTNKEMKYLYLDTGNSSAKGYCEVNTLKFEVGSTATPYSCACFNSELEQAYYEAADNLAGQNVYQNGDTVFVVKANATQSGNEVVL